MKSEFASSRVTFLGHTDSKLFYERVDVVVVPSLWHEPFGRTAIEPWAYGIPVIASNRGGLAEIVEDGVTGIVVDPDERGSLTRALRRFSADRELVGRLGENCRQRLPRFSQESITDGYASLFTGVMRQDGHSVACSSAKDVIPRGPRRKRSPRLSGTRLPAGGAPAACT
jgi:glycosyltransferase involved in cell wall biosynthesis